MATQRKLDALVREVTEAVITECRRLHPDNTVISTAQWCDIWHDCCQPIELEVRRRINRLGVNFEKWAMLEDNMPEYSVSRRKIWKK